MSATKELPHPASPKPLVAFPTSSEYAEKVLGRFHHHHNISDSTAASNDSSPTTTCSTIDDSSATEASPGSSPESPPPNSFAAGMFRPRTAHEQSAPFFELQKAAPPKKGRNLKNLAVNTSRTPGRASSTTSLPLAQKPEPEPSIMSPSFVKPPSPPKRKPSSLGLTIQTPASINAQPQQIKLAIPATPSFGRPGTLRHFQSSPSLPLFPSLGEEQTIAPRPFQTTTLETIFSPTEGPQVQAKVDEEQNFDVPLSREEKPEAYPDGPICVHEPYIDLYLEPTAEQARQYDVVMNVAVEVRNPFDTQSKSQLPEPEVRIDGGGGIQYAPKREKSSQPEETQQPSSPSTPKATPSGDEPSPQPDRQPEYIHIQWEHNSDIVPDLFGLVKQIDEKVMDQKKVLIHCQCGVSRSASLVVAYWLYKNPSLSVQEAYDAVKGKSKWIGPNMNFIMQLQEFRSSLARGGQLADDRGLSPITPRSALSDWPGPFSARSSDTGPRSSGLSPGSYGFNRPVPDKDSLPALSPGPSSAPSGMPWPKDHNETTNRPRALSSTTTPPTYVDPAGHVIPSVNIVEPERSEIKTKTITVPTFPHKEDDSATPKEPLESPRSTEFAMAPLNPSSEADPADAFGLMSPTSTEFSSSPFDRSALLAQLGMGSMHQHDERPARSQSLRSRQPQNTFSENAQSLGTPANRTLRGKVSSPSMREQQELQRLQADIEAKLHLEQKQQQQQQSQQQNWQQPNVSETSFAGLDEALMSPRATEFTENPFAMALSPPSQASAAPDEAHDPRSPAHKGVSPITRNIGDVL